MSGAVDGVRVLLVLFLRRSFSVLTLPGGRGEVVLDRRFLCHEPSLLFQALGRKSYDDVLQAVYLFFQVLDLAPKAVHLV